MSLTDKLPDPIRRHLPREKAARQFREAAAAPQVSESELRRRRDELADEFAQQQYHFGGMVYEMAIRDHYRLDVVTARAAEIQKLDSELAEAERLLRLEEAGAAGTCKYCGSYRSRGALFCWKCGKQLDDAPAANGPDAPGTPAAGPETGH